MSNEIQIASESKVSVGYRLRQLVCHTKPGQSLLGKLLLSVTVYTVLVCIIDNHDLQKATTVFEANAAVSISAVVGILLIFRNNSAYERWWEARKLWGQLVNDSRNLAIKTRAYAIGISTQERLYFASLITNFATALKLHLRQERDPRILDALEIPDCNQHIPSALALKVYQFLKEWRKNGQINEFEQLQLDQHARSLMDICGATERIVKSPIAGTYKFLLWLGISLNVLCLPWFLVPSFHWWSLAIMLVSSYFIFGLELLAEEVERPFDDLPNDLPLDSICDTIAKSVEEILEVDAGNNELSPAVVGTVK